MAKIFIQKIQSSYPGITIDVFEDIETDHLLPPSQAFHLFQIVKEAVNNALRHSCCQSINLVITGKKNWKISITDDNPNRANCAQNNDINHCSTSSQDIICHNKINCDAGLNLC